MAMTLEHREPELLLTTSRVAFLLGVHASTVKRWCSSGQLLAVRTQGGHRRIHLYHVLDHARRHGIQTMLTPFVPYERHVWTALEDVLHHDRYVGLHSLAMGWLVRGHGDRVGQLFSTIGEQDGLPLPRFFDRGIRDFLIQVGEAWHEGRLRVGEEHLVTQVVIEAILRIKDRLLRADGGPESPRPGHAAIVGSMEGNAHHVGALCIRVLLELAGWEVVYLGGDVPVDEFAAMQRIREARLVCVSLAPQHAAADIERCTTILREFYRGDLPYALALGGVGVDADAGVGDAGPFLAVSALGGSEGFLAWLDDVVARRG